MLSTALGKGGGAEEQVMLLSLGLRARGWQVRIVSLLPPKTLLPALEKSDIGIGSLEMTRGIPDPRAMKRFVGELKTFQPDVVHCHMPQANLLARAVRPFHAVPVVISTLHNLTMERVNGSSGRFLEMAHGFTDRFCDITTVICTPAVEGYIQRGAVKRGRITVMYNGVNTGNYQPNPAAREQMRQEMGLDGLFVWLAVGRLTLAKAYPDMIRAFAALYQQNQRTVLLICGVGPLESEIKELARTYGVEKHIRFLGLRQDIPRLMNAADSFLMSSRLEGLPMVLLEASATGLPIVATDVGGNSEIVVDGKTGFIVPPNQVETLTAAMSRMMNLSTAERSIMAAAGRQFVQDRFDLENVLGLWEQLYSELIVRKNGGKRHALQSQAEAMTQ